MRRRAILATVVIFMAAAACDQLFGINEGNLVDASLGDAGPDVVTSGPIIGKQAHYYVQDLQGTSTITAVNTDFSGGVTAWVYESDGGLTAYPGTGDGAGNFTVPGVPPGAVYYMKFSEYSNAPNSQGNGSLVFPAEADFYMITTSRTLDLSEYLGGRADVVYLDAGADARANAIVGGVDYTLHNVTSVDQANSGGDITVFTFNSGFVDTPGSVFDPVYSVLASDGGSAGSTYSGWDPIYTGTPLTKGAETTYITVVDALDAGVDPLNNPPKALTQSASVQVALPGVLQATLATPDASTNTIVTWDRGSFLTYIGNLGKSATVFYQQLGVTAQPFPDAGPFASLSGGLYNYFLPSADGTKEQVALAYRDPFPSTWGRGVGVSVIAKTQSSMVTFPGDAGSFPFFGFGFIQCGWLLGDLPDGGVLQPVISPVQNVAMNGHPGLNDLLDGGTTQPVLSWDLPPVGTPTNYAIGVREIVYTAIPVPKAALHFVAWIYITPELKQVTLPPGVLVPGHTYEFQIIAGTTTTPSTAPLLSGYPICNANTVTGLYVP